MPGLFFWSNENYRRGEEVNAQVLASESGFSYGRDAADAEYLDSKAHRRSALRGWLADP